MLFRSPAFSAVASGAQTLTAAAFNKISLQTEQFDTNNNFDNATNYRFLPTVAGYYLINANIYIQSNTTMTRVIGSIYKNGSTIGRFFDNTGTFGTSPIYASGGALIYFNGSTDYVELYAYVDGTGTISSNTPNLFQGFLARAA